MAASDARPVPRKNAAFRFYFAIRKNDGTLITTWAGADSEVSIDGAAFSDCTNEATEIGTTGCGYIDFTSGEMNGDAVVYKLTVTNTSALPIVVTFFPEESGDYRADMTLISGDATAADNAEAYFDGTGYAGTGNVIPTVTTLTNDPSGVTTLLSRLSATRAGYLDNLSGGAVATQASVNTIDDFVDTEIAAIISDLATLLSRISATRAGYLDNLSGGAVATQASVNTIDDFLDTEIAAIMAKTDLIPSDPADASDIAASFTTVNTKLDTIDDFLDTEVAAIKSKTDNLPADPADASDIAASFSSIASAISGLNNLSEANVRTAVGLASANLDTQLSTIDTVVDGIKVVTDEAATLTTSGTAQTGSSTTSVIGDNALSSSNDRYNNMVMVFTGGANAGIPRQITDYVGSSRTFTVDAFPSTPSNGDTFVLMGLIDPSA